MADNFLERQYEDWLKRKAQRAKASQSKRTKTKFYTRVPKPADKDVPLICTLFVWLLTSLFALPLEAQPWTRYSEWMAYSEIERTPHPYYLDHYSKPRWSYSVGIEVEAIYDVYASYPDGNERIKAYADEYPEKMIAADGSITGYKYADFNLDNVRPGKLILKLYQANHRPQDSVAVATMLRQLDNQPRTKMGPWWHKNQYHDQVWLDGIFMGLPLYTMAAPTYHPGEEERYYDDAVQQITATDSCTYDAATDLWKHAWDESKSMFWADPSTGRSQHTWGRALGWYCMALVEVLDNLPENYARRDTLIQTLRHVMASVHDYQDKESHVWYDVMDVENPRNYLEATCTAMFTYCMLKGARMGWLDSDYYNIGIEAYRGMVRQFVRDNGDGTMSLTRCCEVSGLGPESNPKRDGSFEYYMSENVRDNDSKGVGPFIWASLEMERMGYTIDNLFTLQGFDPVTTLAPTSAAAPCFNLSGQRVKEGTRGFVVSGGAVRLR